MLPVALQDHLVTSKEQLLRRLTRERDAPVDTEKEKEEQQQEFVLIMGNDAGGACSKQWLGSLMNGVTNRLLLAFRSIPR